MSKIEPDARINLSKAIVIIIDASQHSLDVTAQILKGFGVATMHRFSTLDEANKYLRQRQADMILIDPSVDHGAGYDFVNELRHSGTQNAFVPVILVSGHVHPSDVARARNTGSNFVVTKPLAPTVLLQRVMWVAKDKRPFVEAGAYIGPDRRFKFEGPPIGSDGRRRDDLKTPLGDANEANLSIDELDALIKPQRVAL